MSTKLTRRRFVQQSAFGAIAVPMFLPGISRANQQVSKLSYAVVGVGGLQGWNDLSQFASHPRLNVTALCDVDENFLKATAAKFPDARLYRDYREMIATEGDRIDAVSVTIPDHMHAPVGMTAINAGKHVYVQKPLTHDVYEARQLREAAAKKGVVTQMGNQIHSHSFYKLAVQLVRDGAIGKVREVHSWSNAPGNTWKQNIARAAGSDPVPEHLKWELWLGIAPQRPYKEGAYHTVAWRGYQDFGGGAMGDFGCHIMDTPFTALDLNAPTTISAEVPEDWKSDAAINGETWPAWEIITYQFPAGDNELIDGDSLKLMWYDGGKQPSREATGLPEGRGMPGGGSIYIGSKGNMLIPHVGAPSLYPAETFEGFQYPKVQGESHYHQWVNACLGEGKTSSHFDYAGPLTEAVQLGNIANRFPGQTLQWDGEALRITNVPKANDLLRRTYRDGWQVAGLS